MRVKAMLKGNLYIWWLTHRQEARLAILCLMLLALLLALFESRILAVTEEKLMVEKMLDDAQLARALPTTVFLLEATSVQKAQQKLARIAGDLDVARHEMGRTK